MLLPRVSFDYDVFGCQVAINKRELMVGAGVPGLDFRRGVPPHGPRFGV